MNKYTESSEIVKKLRKLEEYMDTLGVQLSWDGSSVVFYDIETETEALYKESGNIGATIDEFPLMFESILVTLD